MLSISRLRSIPTPRRIRSLKISSTRPVPGPDIEQVADLLLTNNLEHGLLDLGIVDVQPADAVPILGVAAKVFSRRTAALLAYRFEAPRIGLKRGMGLGIHETSASTMFAARPESATR